MGRQRAACFLGFGVMVFGLTPACAALAPGVDDVLPMPMSLAFRIEPAAAPWGQAGVDRSVVLQRWWPTEQVLATGRLAAGQDRGLLSLVMRPGGGLHEAVIREDSGKAVWLAVVSRSAHGEPPALRFTVPGTVVALAARWAVRHGRDPGSWDLAARTRSKAATDLAVRLSKEVRGGILPEGATGWLERKALSWEVRIALDDLASGSRPLATPSPAAR
ncbi:MAG: hypothetical protein VKO64_11940 [Candidatus Sericytochromatia bacterium]|nr:hypothetical protein [Candidatus Sericytochromatia bacterium]